MSTITKSVNKALVFCDSDYPNRWYDAFGPGVVKYLQEFVTLDSDSITGDPTEWQIVATEAGAGTSTAVVTDVEGGALLITAAADAADGWQMQLGAAAGECVKLLPGKPCYFGIKFQASDVTDVGFLAGLCVTDVDALGAVADGLYFRSVNGTAVLNFVTENTSVEGATVVGTLVAATEYIAEFFYDGYRVTPYLNGQTWTATARTDASFPYDHELRLTFEFLNGASGAETCTVNWIRMIHLSQ